VETLRWTSVTTGANLRSKGQGHWELKCKNRFLLISKMDRFTSDQHQDQHISPAEMLYFVMFVCHYSGEGGRTSQQPPGCSPSCWVFFIFQQN